MQALQMMPAFLHMPHVGCALSHRTFRVRHSSQARPGCCRDPVDLVDFWEPCEVFGIGLRYTH